MVPLTFCFCDFRQLWLYPSIDVYSTVQWCKQNSTLVCKVQCSDMCSTSQLFVQYSAVLSTVQCSGVYSTEQL